MLNWRRWQYQTDVITGSIYNGCLADEQETGNVSKRWNHSDLVRICDDIQELLLFAVITQQKKETNMTHPSNKKNHNALSRTVDKEGSHQLRIKPNSNSALLVRKTYWNVSKN